MLKHVTTPPDDADRASDQSHTVLHTGGLFCVAEIPAHLDLRLEANGRLVLQCAFSLDEDLDVVTEVDALRRPDRGSPETIGDDLMRALVEDLRCLEVSLESRGIDLDHGGRRARLARFVTEFADELARQGVEVGS